MRADLPKQHLTSSALQGLQFMTNDYIKGKAGFYITSSVTAQLTEAEQRIVNGP